MEKRIWIRWQYKHIILVMGHGGRQYSHAVAQRQWLSQNMKIVDSVGGECTLIRQILQMRSHI